MPYPEPDADRVFIIAIAVLAAVVAMVFLVAVFILVRSAKKGTDHTRPQRDPAAENEAEAPAVPVPQDPSLPEPAFSKRTVKVLWGIPLTTALMILFALALLFIANFLPRRPGFPVAFIAVLIGMAAGGAIGRRMANLGEMETIGAALLCVYAFCFLAATNPAFLVYTLSVNTFLLLFPLAAVLHLPWFRGIEKMAGSWLNTLNWFVCLILASFVAYPEYTRVRAILAAPLPIPAFFHWSALSLAALGPACFAVAWLRLTGLKWLPALLLIPTMPAGIFVVWFVRSWPFILSN
jgi:hypothetical protein